MPHLTPQLIPLEWLLLVTYWALQETEILTGPKPTALHTQLPLCLGYRSSTPRVQHNHGNFLLENRVRYGC